MSQIATQGVHEIPREHITIAEQKRSSSLRAVVNGLPNLVVFTLLAAIMWWGHHSGWKLPSLHSKTAATHDDWCSEHLVPESKCVECNATLLLKPKPKGFCKVHGVAECVICNPELAQVKGSPSLPKYDTAAAIPMLRRRENNSLSKVHEGRVQFASDEAAKKLASTLISSVKNP